MSDSSEGWLLTLKRLRREQTTAEAAWPEKPRSTRPPRTRASRVVRPAFATLAQHFNQGSDGRSWCAPTCPRRVCRVGSHEGSGWSVWSPRSASQGDYHQVGVEVVREGRREFVYYLLISADEAGIAVRKVVTDADAEQSEANAGVKAAPPSGHLSSGDAHRQQSGLSRKVGDEGQQREVFRSDIPNPWWVEDELHHKCGRTTKWCSSMTSWLSTRRSTTLALVASAFTN